MRSRVVQLQEEFGDLQLSEITPFMVDTYVTKRAAIRKPATVNRELQILHHMFCKAQEWEKAYDNLVKHQRPLRANNRRLRYRSRTRPLRIIISRTYKVRGRTTNQANRLLCHF